MPFTGIFRRGKLRPMWQYQADGTLWRICPAPLGRLIGEERDLDRKQASFFCIEQHSGDVLWAKKRFGEEWWIGIEAVFDHILLLHRFATPDLPEHRGIIAVDTATGGTIWSADDMKFISCVGRTIVASRHGIGTASTVGLDLLTGAPTQVPDAGPAEAAGTDIMFPVPVDELPEAILNAGSGKRPVHRPPPLELIEHPAAFVLSYRVPSDERNTGKSRGVMLEVVSRSDGSVQYSDVLDSGASAPVPESFFLMQDILYYVKDRRTLIAVRLGTVANS